MLSVLQPGKHTSLSSHAAAPCLFFSLTDLYFKSYGIVARGNPNYFITYGNGKSAARVQQGLRPNGAHRWHSYLKTPK